MYQRLLDKFKSGNIADLEGTNMHLEIPLTKEFINWNLSQIKVSRIESVQLMYINPSDTALHLETSIPLYKNKTIRAEVYEHVTTPDLTMKIHVLDGLNWIERKLIDEFAPSGVDVEGKIIAISLYDFIFSKTDYGFAAKFLQNVRLESRRNEFVLHADIIV